MKQNYDNCSNYLLEVEEKCQEAQSSCLQLLQHVRIKDDEMDRLHKLIVDLQRKCEDDLFIYRPLKEDPID